MRNSLPANLTASIKTVAVILKSLFWTGLLWVFFTLFMLPTWAVTLEDVPNPQQLNGEWVTDLAEILTPETEVILDQLISALEANNNGQIVVVTIPETPQAVSPKEFAKTLFYNWGIENATQGNGILFLISVDDRRVEIRTGYRLTKILPNCRVKEIIEQQITPQFKQGNFNNGTLQGTQALIAAMQASKTRFNLLESWTCVTPYLIGLSLIIALYPFSFLIHWIFQKLGIKGYGVGSFGSTGKGGGFSSGGSSGGGAGGSW